jgi:serine/threonine-protein kinase
MSICPTCAEEGTPGALFCGSCGSRLLADAAREQAADPLLGQTLNKTYFIQQKIGSGGMGDVYKAIHKKLESPVAIKIVKRELLAHSAMLHRFQREARSASKLRHPNVVAVTDFGQSDDGTVFMVMEYVSGKSLAKVIAEEAPLPEARVVRIGAQILGALAVAHANDILHRDLKPENVMVESRRDAADSVKVLDFGIVKLLAAGVAASTLTQVGLVCGTPGYMSPEQLRGDDLDPRSDLFSVGVVLYEMLTHKLPFNVQTPMEMLHRHLTEPIPPPSARVERPVSPVLEELVMQSLSPARDARPASAEEMRERLLVSMPVTGTAALATEQRGVTEVLPRRDSRRQTAPPPARMTPSLQEKTPPRTPATPLEPEARDDLSQTRKTPRPPSSKSGTVRRVTNVGATKTGRASSFDPALLKKIEARLTPLLGPVAPHLVGKTSRTASSLDDLCHALAAFIPTLQDQKAFLQWSSAQLHVSLAREGRRSPETPAPAVTWDPAVLDRARRNLAVHLGPLARVIVQRVSPRARSAEELYELLAREIPNEAEREAFRRQVSLSAGVRGQ